MKKYLYVCFVVSGLIALACLLSSGNAQEGVRPVPDDSIKPLSQLDRIESKLDEVLGVTKDTNQKLNNLEQSGVKNTDRIVEAILQVKKPAADVVKIRYREVSSPKWRINGKVWSRSGIITHLMTHSAHRGKFKRAELELMSTKQLWAVHDDHHDSMALDVVPIGPEPVVGDCPGGVCPPRRSLFRFRLFRR